MLDPLEDAVLNGTMQDILLVYWYGDNQTSRYEIAQEYSLQEMEDELDPETATQLLEWLTEVFEKYPEGAALNQQAVSDALAWGIEMLEQIENKQIQLKERRSAAGRKAIR